VEAAAGDGRLAGSFGDLQGCEVYQKVSLEVGTAWAARVLETHNAPEYCAGQLDERTFMISPNFW